MFKSFDAFMHSSFIQSPGLFWALTQLILLVGVLPKELPTKKECTIQENGSRKIYCLQVTQLS